MFGNSMYPWATQQLDSSAPMYLAPNNLPGNVCPSTFNSTPFTFANSMHTSATQQCCPIPPMSLAVYLKEPWKTVLNEEFEKLYFKDLERILTPKYLAGTLCPPAELIFNAFNLTPFDRVKVVILGQDPYPGYGQAMGLSFSVHGINIPPSLNNIYSELERDPNIVFSRPNHGNLVYWAMQGVLLLNTVLTVDTQEIKNPDVWNKWQEFTNKVIELISKGPRRVVFMLWGGLAHKKENLIDTPKHGIIKTRHPSPKSAINKSGKDKIPFLNGSYCFSVCNDYLRQLGHSHIDWNLPTY